jgi:hypothetical protein
LRAIAPVVNAISPYPASQSPPQPRFARSLKAVVYHRGTNYMSYGAKMVPPAGNLALNEQQQQFLTIYG